jgi:hypothetical protein
MNQRKLPPMKPRLPSPTWIVHGQFIPARQPGRPCVICLAPHPDFCCERCGALFHGDCHYRHAATEDERDRILTVPQDWPGVKPMIMLCSGCRS